MKSPDTPRSDPSFVRKLWSRVPTRVALLYLGVVTVVAVLAPLLSPLDPNVQDLSNVLEGPSSVHWLGTDSLGRDVLSRLMHSARISLYAAVIAVTLAAVVGVVLGHVGGFFSGWADRIVTVLTDSLMGFPPILLAIGVVGVLGPNLTNAMIAVGIVFVPRMIRVSRSAVISIRNETYVDASRSIGTPSSRILLEHVLPNALPPIIVQLSLMTGFAMLAEASLSFLGLGVQPPSSSWGSMLGASVRTIKRQPLLMVWPGMAIAVTVLAFNVLGDGIRDAFGGRASAPSSDTAK